MLSDLAAVRVSCLTLPRSTSASEVGDGIRWNPRLGCAVAIVVGVVAVGLENVVVCVSDHP